MARQQSPERRRLSQTDTAATLLLGRRSCLSGHGTPLLQGIGQVCTAFAKPPPCYVQALPPACHFQQRKSWRDRAERNSTFPWPGEQPGVRNSVWIQRPLGCHRTCSYACWDTALTQCICGKGRQEALTSRRAGQEHTPPEKRRAGISSVASLKHGSSEHLRGAEGAVGPRTELWECPQRSLATQCPGLVGCAGVITMPQAGKLSRLLDTWPVANTRTYLPHSLSVLSFPGS